MINAAYLETLTGSRKFVDGDVARMCVTTSLNVTAQLVLKLVLFI